MNTTSLRVSCFAVSCVALFAGLHNPVFGKPKPPDPAEEESKRIKERRDAEFAAREAEEHRRRQIQAQIEKDRNEQQFFKERREAEEREKARREQALREQKQAELRKLQEYEQSKQSQPASKFLPKK